jgi:hypothetical protein
MHTYMQRVIAYIEQYGKYGMSTYSYINRSILANLPA